MKEIKLIVSAVSHDRQGCPATIKVPKEKTEIYSGDTYGLKDESGTVIPVQLFDKEDCFEMYWIITGLKAGEQKSYTLCKVQNQWAAGVEIIPKDNKIDIIIGGKPFTSYVYGPTLAKPYMGPVLGTYGQKYTRLDLDVKEHPHQRSVWMAIGDVNGIDFWNEKGDYGKQKILQTSSISGPILGNIDAEILWTDFTGNPIMDEFRTLTFYNMPSSGRYVDIESTFKASYGKTVFGSTKEAGPLGIRVAESMKVTNGGTMINSYGAVGEEECWGRAANWCDYYGITDGYLSGIAVYDHPENDRYPTRWHIRNYGLFAPNNFYFTGSRTLEEGENVTYRYRMFFHDGDTKSAQVAQRFHDYVNMPKIEII